MGMKKPFQVHGPEEIFEAVIPFPHWTSVTIRNLHSWKLPHLYHIFQFIYVYFQTVVFVGSYVNISSVKIFQNSLKRFRKLYWHSFSSVTRDCICSENISISSTHGIYCNFCTLGYSSYSQHNFLLHVDVLSKSIFNDIIRA
jgi:hypothetical protein